jgi:hypothetical protein
MRLTPDQHRDIARRAIWYFDCFFGPPSDSIVFTGDGADDLDSLISRLTDNAANNHVYGQKFLCDVGTQYSDWRPFDIEDVQRIRDAYVEFFGTVNKPDVFSPGASTAFDADLV